VRRYRKVASLGLKVVKLLAMGVPSPVVCKRLGISRSLEQYHRHKAMERGIIKKVGKGRPFIYEKGPNHSLLSSRGQRGRRCGTFVQHYCRLHAANGGTFRFDVHKVGDVEIIKVDGVLTPLFPKDPIHQGREDRYVAAIDLPFDLVGYHNSKATLDFRHSRERSILLVSPPEMHLGLVDLQTTPFLPFHGVVDYVERLLCRYAGWRLGQPEWDGRVHYAFLLDAVDHVDPDLQVGLPLLQRGTEEERLVLYCDNSHGHPEIETTDRRIAVDIMAILEARLRGRA